MLMMHILFRIGEVIDDDVLHARVPFVARTQQCFAVKAGTDGLLDIARRSFCDTSEGIFEIKSTFLSFIIPIFSILIIGCSNIQLGKQV